MAHTKPEREKGVGPAPLGLAAVSDKQDKIDSETAAALREFIKAYPAILTLGHGLETAHLDAMVAFGDRFWTPSLTGKVGKGMFVCPGPNGSYVRVTLETICHNLGIPRSRQNFGQLATAYGLIRTKAANEPGKWAEKVQERFRGFYPLAERTGYGGLSSSVFLRVVKADPVYKAMVESWRPSKTLRDAAFREANRVGKLIACAGLTAEQLADRIKKEPKSITKASIPWLFMMPVTLKALSNSLSAAITRAEGIWHENTLEDADALAALAEQIVKAERSKAEVPEGTIAEVGEPVAEAAT